MNFFEPNINQKPIINKNNLKKWVFDKAYTCTRNQLQEQFTEAEYIKNPNKYLHFSKLSNEFVCANPDCESNETKCIWFTFNGIAPRVDETFAEFYCSECNKYTFVEYYRDDS